MAMAMTTRFSFRRTTRADRNATVAQALGNPARSGSSTERRWVRRWQSPMRLDGFNELCRQCHRIERVHRFLEDHADVVAPYLPQAGGEIG